MTADGSTTITFDNNGNQTGFSSTSYSYDDENQMTSAQVSQSWKTDFIYDGKNRLRKRIEYAWNGTGWQSSSETRYIYDGMLVVQQGVTRGHKGSHKGSTRGRSMVL